MAHDETPATTPPGPPSNTVTPTPDEHMKEENEQIQNEAPEDEDMDIDPSQTLSLPISKIKKIFKMDPEYTAASQNAVYATGLATELFVQYFVEQASLLAKIDKRKKIAYKDFSNAVAGHDSLNFLSDTVPKTQPIGPLIENKEINLPSKVNIKEFKETLMSKDSNKSTPSKESKKTHLVKGQQTLPFGKASKVESKVKKAVIDELVISDQPDDTTPTKGPVANDGDVPMAE